MDGVPEPLEVCWECGFYVVLAMSAFPEGKEADNYSYS